MKKIIPIALLVIAMIIGSSCFVVTNENEYSLVRQFGRIVAVHDEAGVTFKMPFVQTETWLQVNQFYSLTTCSQQATQQEPVQMYYTMQMLPQLQFLQLQEKDNSIKAVNIIIYSHVNKEAII